MMAGTRARIRLFSHSIMEQMNTTAIFQNGRKKRNR